VQVVYKLNEKAAEESASGEEVEFGAEIGERG
jgi:hypothetical protein